MLHLLGTDALPALRGGLRSILRLLARLPDFTVIGLMPGNIAFPLSWMLPLSFGSPNAVCIVRYWPTERTPINFRAIRLWPEIGRVVHSQCG